MAFVNHKSIKDDNTTATPIPTETSIFIIMKINNFIIGVIDIIIIL